MMPSERFWFLHRDTQVLEPVESKGVRSARSSDALEMVALATQFKEVLPQTQTSCRDDLDILQA